MKIDAGTIIKHIFSPNFSISHRVPKSEITKPSNEHKKHAVIKESTHT